MKIRPHFMGSMACLILALASHAAPITYFTEGSFNGGAFLPDQSQAYTNGTSLRFVGAGGTVDTDSNISLGTFILEKMDNGLLGVLSGTFSLRITQVNPNPGSGSLDALLTGNVTVNSSTGQVKFDSNTVELSNATYRLGDALFDQPFSVGLIAPTSGTNLGAGITSLEGTVTATSSDVGDVPEPATYALLGSGLLAIGLLHRRRS